MEDEVICRLMIDRLRKLEKAIDEGVISEEIIESYVKKSNMLTASQNLGLNLSLYRARFDSGFDKTDPTQFGYIHDLDKITRFRYNKDHEAVLYTSTFPSVAYLEIESGRKSETHFYLSVWSHKKSTRDFYCALNVNGNNLQDGSTVYKYYKILIDNVGDNPSKLCYLELLGELLEKQGTDYRFSSILASNLFEKHDALITTSMKSQGRELNITFNQFASDNLLDLKYIYRCAVPSDNTTLAYKVEEIGIPHTENVEWHKWELDFDSIDFAVKPTIKVDIERLKTAIKTKERITSVFLYPNVNKKPDDLHCGIVEYDGVRYRLSFRIKLMPISNMNQKRSL